MRTKRFTVYMQVMSECKVVFPHVDRAQ